jgi:hypothetical protein
MVDWHAWGLGFTVEHVVAGYWLLDLNAGPLFVTLERRR